MLPHWAPSTVNWLARSFFVDETLFNNIHVSYAINGTPQKNNGHHGH